MPVGAGIPRPPHAVHSSGKSSPTRGSSGDTRGRDQRPTGRSAASRHSSQLSRFTLTRHDCPDARISGPSFRTQPRRASVSHGHSASRLRRHQFHAVAVPGEHGIVGQQKQGLRLRLGHEHPIERVCMHRRQFGDGRGMLACDWHQLASSPGPHATHRVENGCGSASDRTIL